MIDWTINLGNRFMRYNAKNGTLRTAGNIIAAAALVVNVLMPLGALAAVGDPSAPDQVNNIVDPSTLTLPPIPAPPTPGPTATTVIVRPSNTQGWSETDTRPGGVLSFVNDATSPLPTGSLKLTTNSATTAKVQYMHASSTSITDVLSLSYSTKQNSAGFVSGDPSYQLPVFANGTTGFTTFVYEPYQNGTVTNGAWQTWDVSGGQFWSTKTVTCSGGTITAGAGGPPFYTLTQIKTICPAAKVIGYGVNVGSNNPSYDVQTDKFVFGTTTTTTTYDFEQDVVSDTTAPPLPVHLSPADGSFETTASLVKVDWTDVTDPSTPVTYYYQSSHTPDTNVDGSFVTPAYSSGALTTSEIPTPGTPAGVYYWHVRAVDGANNSSAWTNPWKFTVDNGDPLVVPCGVNSVKNGGFESPVVATPQNWNTYDSGTAGLGWSVSWVRPAGAPAIAKAELHRGVNGWAPHSGSQHTELDSDRGGPSNSVGGDASVKMYQDLITKVGSTYTIKLWTSPRPGTGLTENSTEVKMGSTVLDVINEDGSANANTVWTEHTYAFTATGTLTRLSLTDLGIGNSLGGFVDDVSVVEDCVSAVTICKYNTHERALSGWDVFLKGPKEETVTVNPDGIDHLSNTLPAGDYLFVANGTYVYRPGEPTASISDAAFSKRLPSDSVYSIGTSQPWVRELDFPAPYTGYLGIQVNQANINWGTTFNPAHQYSAMYHVSASGKQKFRILDDVYGDNSGSLTVDVYPIFKGTTQENGCVTLTGVPYGNYTLDEIMQDGWTNQTGQGSAAVVNAPTQTFNLVNKKIDPCDPRSLNAQLDIAVSPIVCTKTINGTKFNDKNGDGKRQEGEPGLAGFHIVAVDKVETNSYTVDSTSAVGSTATVPAGKYLVVANGAWNNRIGSGSAELFDAEYYTQNTWSTHTDGTTPGAYAGAGPNEGDLMVNNTFVNWGPYQGSHSYGLVYNHAGGPLNFSIFDGDATTGVKNPAWYGDNSGTLGVKLYKVLAEADTNVNGDYSLDIPNGTAASDLVSVFEIQKADWTQTTPSSPNYHSVDLSNEDTLDGNDFGNKSDIIPTTNLHFIKVVCDKYSDVSGNNSANTADATGGKYTQFKNYANGAFTPSPLVDGMVNPSEIPGRDSSCARANGWNFKLSSDITQTTDTQTVGPTANGEFVTTTSGQNSALTPALQTAVATGQLWVSEVTQTGYDFAAIRCYKDAAYGDNLEVITLGNDQPTDIYCIAYNIRQVPPCVVTPISLVSGTLTKFEGLKEGGAAPADLTNPANYPSGTAGNAVAVGPTGYPGAWDAAINDPKVSGAVFVSNSATQPTNTGGPGFNGSVDSWRLFSQTFTIPAGATAISSPKLHIAADNEVKAYLDGTLIATSTSFSSVTDSGSLTLTPGTHTLKFSVKNYAFDQTNNPTGVIYKLDTITYACSGGGGGTPKFKVSGNIYNDLNNDGTKNGAESGLPGWTVTLSNYNSASPGAAPGAGSAVGTKVSDADGNYIFLDIAQGCYVLQETPQSGWTITEPTNASHQYLIALGGAICPFSPIVTEQSFVGKVLALVINTASASSSGVVTVNGDAIGLNFGNFSTQVIGGGGGGGGGGTIFAGGTGANNSGSGSTPPGQVLGDSTNIPSGSGLQIPLNPQVLGAAIELPRTGTPANVLWALALSALVIAGLRKRGGLLAR